jgi:hypothetical protein
MADEVDTQDTETEGPKQTINRMPPETTVGPFFPSGMSAPEAAMAGATANLTDEEKEKISEMATEYGVEGGGEAPE